MAGPLRRVGESRRTTESTREAEKVRDEVEGSEAAERNLIRVQKATRVGVCGGDDGVGKCSLQIVEDRLSGPTCSSTSEPG